MAAQGAGEQLAKQLVQSIPLFLVAEEIEEKLLLPSLLQKLPGLWLAGDLLAQGRMELFQDRALQQKALHRLWLLSQHLFGEILGEEVIFPVQVFQQAVALQGLSTQRKQSQTYPGKPPLRAFFQQVDRSRLQFVLAGQEQVLFQLGPFQPQIAAPDLEHLFLQPQARESQCRFVAAQEEPVQRGGGAFDRKGQQFVHGGVFQPVQIVQGQHDSGSLRDQTVQKLQQQLEGGDMASLFL